MKTNEAQLEVWSLEGKLAAATTDEERRELASAKLRAQRRLIEPPMRSAAGLLPPVGGVDLVAILRDHQQRPEADRAAEELALRARDEERAAAEKAKRQRGREVVALRGVPPHFAELVTSPGLRRTAAVCAVEGIERGVCFLLGPHDASKSTAAAYSLRPRGVWVSGVVLMDEWIKRRGEILSARRVVIDEFGRFAGSQDQRAADAEILAKIVQVVANDHGGWVCVTSNRGREGLREVLSTPRRGESRESAAARWTWITERLREHGQPRATTPDIKDAGGEVIRPGLVLCPFEGFRRTK